VNSPKQKNRELFQRNRELPRKNREFGEPDLIFGTDNSMNRATGNCRSLTMR
jgi:hypothetical protein